VQIRPGRTGPSSKAPPRPTHHTAYLGHLERVSARCLANCRHFWQFCRERVTTGSNTTHNLVEPLSVSMIPITKTGDRCVRLEPNLIDLKVCPFNSTIIYPYCLLLALSSLVFSSFRARFPTMSFSLASTLFKKSFNNIDPSTWHDIYDHEYNCHDNHFRIAETTISQYRKLSDPKKLRKFLNANTHWGILILNDENDICLVHTIHCMRDPEDGCIGIFGNELVPTPIQFKINTSVMAECWFPEQILTKHLVNIIMISGYYDDEEPLPADTDDDIAIYESSLLQRKYAFGPGKVAKTIKRTPRLKQETSSSVPIQGNNIMFRHFFLQPYVSSTQDHHYIHPDMIYTLSLP
jgi:hypothetical protein